jgi:predicted nucleic acid-binding protein
MRVVLDTSVMLSAYLGWGESRQCLDIGRAGGVELHCCGEIENEFSAMLKSASFALSPEEIDMLLVDYHSFTTFGELTVLPATTPVAVRQNIGMTCALSCGAKYVVSADKRLLALKRYRGVRALTPDELLKRVYRVRMRQRKKEALRADY